MRPVTSPAETEGVRPVRGVYRRSGFVPGGTFRSFPRSNWGASAPLQEAISEHFSKGRVPGVEYNASYGGVHFAHSGNRVSGIRALCERYIFGPGVVKPENGEGRPYDSTSHDTRTLTTSSTSRPAATKPSVRATRLILSHSTRSFRQTSSNPTFRSCSRASWA